MLLYILFTAAALLAAWIWLSHPAPKSTAFPGLALPPRLTFSEIFSIMKASAGTKNGFFDVVQKKYGDLVWIRVPFWSDIALFTSPEYSKTFFAAKEADFLRGYQVGQMINCAIHTKLNHPTDDSIIPLYYYRIILVAVLFPFRFIPNHI